MSELRNILPDPADNLGGIADFFFTESSNILAMPRREGLLTVGNIQMKPGTKWNIFRSTRYTPGFQQAAARSRMGSTYGLEMEGFRAGDTLGLADAFYSMLRRRYVILAHDHDGNFRLIGDPERNLFFTYSLRSGNGPADRKGYTFTFQGRSHLPALFYTGEFEVSGLGLVKVPAGGSGEPVTIMKGNGEIVAMAQPGSKFVITSGFSWGFRIL